MKEIITELYKDNKKKFSSFNEKVTVVITQIEMLIITFL